MSGHSTTLPRDALQVPGPGRSGPIKLRLESFGVTHRGAEIVKGIDAYLLSGELVAIVGEIDSAHSALLDAISGQGLRSNRFDKDTGGISLNGRSFLPRARRATVGAVPLIPRGTWMRGTVQEAFRYAVEASPGFRLHEAGQVTDWLIEEMALESERHRMCATLPLDKKRLLALGIEIAADKPILCLPDPTFALGLVARNTLLHALRRHAEHRGTLILLSVSQEALPQMEQRISLDRILLMRRGKLIYGGLRRDMIPYFKQLGFSPPREGDGLVSWLAGVAGGYEENERMVAELPVVFSGSIHRSDRKEEVEAIATDLVKRRLPWLWSRWHDVASQWTERFNAAIGVDHSPYKRRARAILAYAYQYTQHEFSQHEFQHEVSQHEFQRWFSSWSGFGPHVAEALYHKAHATQRHLDSTAWKWSIETTRGLSWSQLREAIDNWELPHQRSNKARHAFSLGIALRSLLPCCTPVEGGGGTPELKYAAELVRLEALAKQDGLQRLEKARRAEANVLKLKLSLAEAERKALQVEAELEQEQLVRDVTRHAGKAPPIEDGKYGEGSLIELIFGASNDTVLPIAQFMRVPETHIYEAISRPDEGVAAIELEVAAHGTDEDREVLQYVLYQRSGSNQRKWPNGILDKGREDGLQLDDFAAMQEAKVAKLSRAMCLALRLYTTCMYRSLNNPMRRELSEAHPHPYPVTMYLLSEGVKRLRAVDGQSDRANTKAVLWRGMRNMKLSDADEFSRNGGGAEKAPMSTTHDLAVAIRYSTSKSSILLRLATEGFRERGADLRWISAFPGESEVLYPPLTYLRKTYEQEIRVPIPDENDEYVFRVIFVKPSFG